MTVAILDDADQGLALAQAQAELMDKSELARLEVGTGVKSLLSVEPNYVQPLRGKGSRA